jgi:UDP-GlcNAc:undecaprenyl-phosphate GlcNAc-1-phosphate transferase
MIVLYALLVVLVFGLCLAAAPLGRSLGVIDVPDGARKTHGRGTPLVGGIATVLPVLAAAVFLATVSPFRPFYGSLSVILALFLLLGLVDDRRHMRPLWRLGISAAACIGVLVAVPGLEITFLKFSFLTNTIFLGGFGLVFTVLCLVGLQNAINMADGKNGLVMGLALVWTVGLIYFAPSHVEPVLIAFALGLVIALPFNLGGRLFLGDSGTYSISVLVGLLTIYVYNVNFAALTADVVALWFLIPVVDCLRLIVARMIAGRLPFSPDRNHLHHILWGLLPRPAGLLAYLGLVGVPFVLALARPDLTLIWVFLALASYAVIIGLARWRSALGRLTAH